MLGEISSQPGYAAVFSAIRMYAVSRGSWWLSLTVCLLSVVPVATNAVSPMLPEQFTTTEVTDPSYHYQYTLYAANWYQIEDIPIIGVTCVNGSNLSSAINTA